MSCEVGTEFLYFNYVSLPHQRLLRFAVDFIDPRLSCYTNSTLWYMLHT
jgi:hypothetical protein